MQVWKATMQQPLFTFNMQTCLPSRFMSMLHGYRALGQTSDRYVLAKAPAERQQDHATVTHRLHVSRCYLNASACRPLCVPVL
jgi:hypothetical protein